jgi:hypothetical protein
MEYKNEIFAMVNAKLLLRLKLIAFPYIKDYKINKTISNKSVEYRSPIQNSPLPLA